MQILLVDVDVEVDEENPRELRLFRPKVDSPESVSPKLTSIRTTKYNMLIVEEYISQGKDRFLVDPNPNLLHTKRKLAKQRAAVAGENITTSCAIASRSVVQSSEQTLSFPDSTWIFGTTIM